MKPHEPQPESTTSKKSILQSLSAGNKRGRVNSACNPHSKQENSTWLKRALKRKKSKTNQNSGVDHDAKLVLVKNESDKISSAGEAQVVASSEAIDQPLAEEIEAINPEVLSISQRLRKDDDLVIVQSEENSRSRRLNVKNSITRFATYGKHAGNKTFASSKTVTTHYSVNSELAPSSISIGDDYHISSRTVKERIDARAPYNLEHNTHDSSPPQLRCKEIDFFLYECERFLLSPSEFSLEYPTLVASSTIIPRCYHALECQIVTVKKNNTNKGKSFYCCPLHAEEGRCEYFGFQEDYSPYALSRLISAMEMFKSLDASFHVEDRMGLRPHQNMTGDENYDESMLHNLRVVFGHVNFRQGQLWAIRRVLESRSSVLILPTGAGKSLCYQYPALFLSGVTVVISPLIALMQDQYEQLPPKLKEHAAVISSASVMRKSDWVDVLIRLRKNYLKLLFVSPERAATEQFSQLFTLSNVSISLLCLDEAHCLSEWSHHFRPSYLQLFSKVSSLASCVLAITATATQDVVQGLLSHIRQDSEEMNENFVMTVPWNRSNVSIQVVSAHSDAERMEHLLHLLADYINLKKPFQGGLLIYAHRQKDTEVLASCLEQQLPARCNTDAYPKSFKIAVFHAGLEAEVKTKVRTQFQRGRIKVLIATVAFGMGVDKRNIRGVIHFHIPSSIEAFVQQIGRAGRDHKPAFSTCYVLAPEISPRRSLLFHTNINEQQLTRLYSIIDNVSNGSEHKGLVAGLSELVVINLQHSSEQAREFVLDIGVAWLEKYVNMNVAMIKTFYVLAELELKKDEWKEAGIQIETSLSNHNQICVITVLEAKLLRLEKDPTSLLISIVAAIRSGKLSTASQIKRRNQGYLTEIELRFSLLQMASYLYDSDLSSSMSNMESKTKISLIYEHKLWRAIDDCREKGSLKVVDLQVPAVRLSLSVLATKMISLKDNLRKLSISVFRKHSQLQILKVARFEKLCAVLQDAAIPASESSPILSLLSETRHKTKKELDLEQQLTRYFDEPTGESKRHSTNSTELEGMTSERVESLTNDIKALVDGEADKSWTDTDIAKLLQGLSSPCYPYQQWRHHNAWRRYEDVRFEEVLAVARDYLQGAADRPNS